MPVEFGFDLLMIQCSPLVFNIFGIWLDWRISIYVKNDFLLDRLHICFVYQFFLFLHRIIKIVLLFILPVKTTPHLFRFIIILKLQCSSMWSLLKWRSSLLSVIRLDQIESSPNRDIVSTRFRCHYIWPSGSKVLDLDEVILRINCFISMIYYWF